MAKIRQCNNWRKKYKFLVHKLNVCFKWGVL